MPTPTSDQRRGSSSGTHRSQTPSRRQSRDGSGGRRPLQARDTGYRVGSARRQKSSRSVNPRLVVVGIVGLLLVIAVVFGISSCIRGCSSSARQRSGTDADTVQVNPDDKRVAYGVTSEVTTRLSEVLDRNEAFAEIAKNADKIGDERLIDLAIAEPDAIAFVAGSITTDGSTKPYDGTISPGELPLLYTFDTRWAYAQYADGFLGVTGSGPVALSMASMGLSGKTTYDPATIAQAITDAKLASGVTGMDDSFVSGHASEVGLTATSVDASSDGIYSPLSESLPVLVKLKADSGIGSASAHWAIVAQLNSDNSITLYDPTSVAASSHSWSLGAVASRTDTAYALAAAAVDTSATDGTDATMGDDASNATATTGGSSTADDAMDEG
ncbi:MAG: hypothetical protein QM302_08285 [Acidobacteriota bacterium]|nr:hypothetical protein [Acidobacteriota bacterium]